MPVPSTINDLSTTAGSNSPAGSDSPATIDDHIRALAAFIAQLRDRPQPSAFGLTLIDDADAATAQQTLGGTTVGRAVFTAADAAAARTAIAAPGTGVANTFTEANTFTGTLTQQSASEAQVRAEKTGAGASAVYLYNSETQVGVWDSVEGGIWNVDKASGGLTIPRAVTINGFTRIGSASAPAIKQYFFTGTTPAAGSEVTLTTLGSREVIVSIQCMVDATLGVVLPPNYTDIANSRYEVRAAQLVASGNIFHAPVLKVLTGQTNVASRTYWMLVTVVDQP